MYAMRRHALPRLRWQLWHAQGVIIKSERLSAHRLRGCASRAGVRPGGAAGGGGPDVQPCPRPRRGQRRQHAPLERVASWRLKA